MDFKPIVQQVLSSALERGDITNEEIVLVDQELAQVEELPAEEIVPITVEEPEQKISQDIRAQIQNMTIPQKIKLAMMGNSVARSLLIFNPNKMIQEFVLKNPRLSEQEVHAFLKSPNISGHALRIIACNKDMMRSYTSRLRLVTNPKTPGDMAVKWIRFLSQTDLKKLAKSKNIPHVVQVTARKLTAE